MTPFLKPGDQVGRYRLVEAMGEGGCGLVFLAEQTEPVRREVAFKTIKPGTDSREVIARFEAERQALAQLDHPNIAGILDAGVTAAGRPYFVMEFISGLRITTYCDANCLPIRRRLELFAQVCHAIEHAHQHGVIHCDLKPANLLVQEAEPGRDAAPKVIDFGIAHSTGQPFTDKTLHAEARQCLGTPAFMSPEQAAGDPDLDPRSDVYSLGAVLYKLLTGRPPLSAVQLRGFPKAAALRHIQATEPLRPSARLAGLPELELAAMAQLRGETPARLARALRGDLDGIVMKCLEKDRARRYNSVAALTEDLERHLRHEPVAAGPSGNWHRLHNFARRNLVPLTAAAAVGFVLAVGITLDIRYLAGMRRAEREGARWRKVARANQRAVRQDALRSVQEAWLLTEILNGAEPSAALGRDQTLLRALLNHAAERAGRGVSSQPAFQADLHNLMAETCRELGRYGQMEELACEALRLSQPVPGAENATAAKALRLLGDARRHLGQLPEAEKACRQAVAMQRKLPGGKNSELAASLNSLGLVLHEQGWDAGAETCFRQALALARHSPGEEHPEAAAALDNLGAALWGQDKFNEAEQCCRESLALRQKTSCNENADLAISLNNLAAVLFSEDKLAEAESLGRAAVAMNRELPAARPPELAVALVNLGNVLAARGRFAEASVANHEAEAIRTASGRSVSGADLFSNGPDRALLEAASGGEQQFAEP